MQRSDQKMELSIHVSIHHAKKLKSDTSKLVTLLKNLIRNGYDLATIVDSLWRVFVVKI